LTLLPDFLPDAAGFPAAGANGTDRETPERIGTDRFFAVRGKPAPRDSGSGAPGSVNDFLFRD